MTEELVKFQFPRSSPAIIKVAGVGGGGCNAVNHMFESVIKDVDYLVCNTDAQALMNSPVPVKIQLGVTLTEGRGAGNSPEMGEEAARENYEDIKRVLEENTKMLFITAGLGGGTGTGAAPVIAKIAHELGILTIAVVTIPSPAEGKKRYNHAIEGIRKLTEYTDSMLVVCNQKLHTIYGDLPARQAFKLADDIVKTAVKGVAEIITLPGIINIDFADVYTVMHESKVFIMGTGYAKGKERALTAVKAALKSPLLDNNDIFGTRNILLNIISGTEEITIGEIGEIIEYLQREAGQEADIIWGNGFDESIGEEISVTIICTGFKSAPDFHHYYEKPQEQSSPFLSEPEMVSMEGNNQVPEEEQRIFELEIDPVEPQNEFIPPVRKNEEEKQTEKQPAKKSKAAKKNEGENDNLESWFYRKFGKLFEDDNQNG